MNYTLKKIQAAENWKELSPFLFFYRKISVIFTWFLLKAKFTPNKISALSVIFGIFAATGFATGEKETIFLGGIMSQIYMILDCTDGYIARVKKICTKFGAVYDVVKDVFVNNVVLLGIGIGLYIQTQRLEILLIPFLALFGMNMTVVTHNTQMMVFRDEPLRDSSVMKELGSRKKFLREIMIKSALSGSFQYFIIGIGAFIDKLLWSTVILAIFQNIYWISLVFLIYISNRNQRIRK